VTGSSFGESDCSAISSESSSDGSAGSTPKVSGSLFHSNKVSSAVQVAKGRKEKASIAACIEGNAMPTRKLAPQLAMLPRAIAAGRGPTVNSSLNIDSLNIINYQIQKMTLPEATKYGMGPNPTP
jgi:hypothetical protein